MAKTVGKLRRGENKVKELYPTSEDTPGGKSAAGMLPQSSDASSPTLLPAKYRKGSKKVKHTLAEGYELGEQYLNGISLWDRFLAVV